MYWVHRVRPEDELAGVLGVLGTWGFESRAPGVSSPGPECGAYSAGVWTEVSPIRAWE